MGLQNRVTPFSVIERSSHHGMFMGNRGCLHGDRKDLRRQYSAEKRWIICLTQFKNRQRKLMSPGQYTELFFLDEATALAAGHRPCAECRREAFDRFTGAWKCATGVRPTAGQINAVLHEERMAIMQDRRQHCMSIRSLPEGVMVCRESEPQIAWLLAHGSLHRWTHGGYTDHMPAADTETVTVLTPPSTVAAMQNGFEPVLHVSVSPG